MFWIQGYTLGYNVEWPAGLVLVMPYLISFLDRCNLVTCNYIYPATSHSEWLVKEATAQTRSHMLTHQAGTVAQHFVVVF